MTEGGLTRATYKTALTLTASRSSGIAAKGLVWHKSPTMLAFSSLPRLRAFALILLCANCSAAQAAPKKTKAGTVTTDAKTTPISDENFWRVIDKARAASQKSGDRQRAIRDELQSADARGLDEFDAVVWGWFIALDRKELWAAADTLMGGCSDDSFTDFRAWLILQGKEKVEAVVKDPDVLASWTYVESPRSEGLLRIASGIRMDKFGKPSADLAFRPATAAWPPDRIEDFNWTEKDCARLFPKISANPQWKRK